jgi:tetratricopeptide (TPR) repeat protein
MSVAQEFSDKSNISFAACAMSVAYTLQGHLGRGIEWGELAVREASTLGDKAFSQMMLARAWCRVGETYKGVELLSSLVTLLEGGAQIGGALVARLHLGEGYLLAGQYVKGQQTLEEQLEITTRCGAREYLGEAHRLLGQVALATSSEQAAPHFEKAIAVFRETGAENELALAYSGMGRYHKQRGNTEQAREYLTNALEIHERLGTLIEPDKVREELAELPETG